MFVVAVEDFLLRDGRLQKSNATGFEPHTNAKISGVDRWMTDDQMRTASNDSCTFGNPRLEAATSRVLSNVLILKYFLIAISSRLAAIGGNVLSGHGHYGSVQHR